MIHTRHATGFGVLVLDLQTLFAETVLSNITAAKNAKNMTDIALINELAERGAFSDNKNSEALNKIKESKRNLYNDWRCGKSKSFLKLIEVIAEILETDVWTLAGFATPHEQKRDPIAKTQPGPFTQQEKEIIAVYRKLDLESQTQFLHYLIELQKQKD